MIVQREEINHKKTSKQIGIIIAGGTLKPTIPSSCPNEIKQILDECFQTNPNLRPTTQQILENLNFYS